MSQHIGDMGSARDASPRSSAPPGSSPDLYRIEPEMVAADAHPGYQTRAWAEDGAGGPSSRSWSSTITPTWPR